MKKETFNIVNKGKGLQLENSSNVIKDLNELNKDIDNLEIEVFNRVSKLPQNQLTWDDKLMICCGDSTTWEMQGNGYSFDYMTSFYRLVGNKMQKIRGYLNFGSSGYTLNGYVNDIEVVPPIINTSTNAGIGAWDYFGHNIQTAISQKTAIAYRKSIPDQDVVWTLSFGINDCILYANIGNQSQTQITIYLSSLLNQAVINLKKEFPADTVILRIPNSMAARPYNAGAGFPSPTAYPTFGADKPTDVILVTKWNNAIRDAYYLVSQKNLNTILLDTSIKIFGEEQSAELDTNFRPYMNNLVHPNGLGYKAIADELAYIFTDERIQKDFSRLNEADLKAALVPNNPYDNYKDYVLDISKYRLILNSKATSNVGTTFIDIPFSKPIFDSLANGRPIYVKHGNNIAKFNSYTSSVISSTQCRLFSLSPSPSTIFQISKGSTSIYLDQITDSTFYRLKRYTVNNLPTGSNAVEGDTAYVTNASTPTYLGIVTGGGTIKCKVFYNGTNWIT